MKGGIDTLTPDSLQLPPPANWQDFESLCCDLWREIWRDPNTQKNGRKGQLQYGVDIFGQPHQKSLWAGVQCKGKDSYTDKILTDKEVRREAKKAKKFKPRLSQFIIATNSPRDAKIQEFARKLTDKYRRDGWFSIHVCFWEDIVQQLANFPHVQDKYYHCLSIGTQGLKIDITEIKGEMVRAESDIKSTLADISDKISNFQTLTSPDILDLFLTSEYNAELDQIKDSLNRLMPNEALKFLDSLKKRVWSTTSEIVKYKLLIYTGYGKLMLNENREAGQLFIEALQYNQDDEKALCKAGWGYLLLGQLEEAECYTRQALKKNPANSRAHAMMVEIGSYKEDLHHAIETVPEPYRSLPEVAYALSFLARKEQKFNEAEKWLKVAIENDKEDLPDFKGALGETIVESVISDEHVRYTNQPSESHKDRLKEAVRLLTLVWERVCNTDIRGLKVFWLEKRGIAKALLGDTQAATRDLDLALTIKPSDPILIKNRALIAFMSNDYEEAISLLENIANDPQVPDTPLMLANVLGASRRYEKAKEIIKKFLKDCSSKVLQEEANRLQIHLDLDSGEIENAMKVSDFMRSDNPKEILNLCDASKILRSSGKASDAVSLLKEVKTYIKETTSFRRLLALATEFYFCEEFEEAADIYNKIANKNENSSPTQRLLECYYKAGKNRQALEISENLYRKYGPSKFLSTLMSTIYEEIGDLSRAKDLYQEYLDKFPNDFDMKLRQALVNFRDHDFEKVDAFLLAPIDANIISLEAGFQIAALCAERNLKEKSLEMLYEMRRRYFNNNLSHLRYIGFFMQERRYEDRLVNINVVTLDSAVCVKTESGQIEWWVIENRKDSDLSRKEINLEHRIAQKLLNKHVGDKIILTDSDVSQEVGEVVAIKSKYVSALQESLSSFEKWFPDASGIKRVRIEPTETKGELPRPIKKQLDLHYERRIKLEEFYKKGILTLGAVANLTGYDLLEVWGGFTRQSDLGLRCCIGTKEESDQAISFLQSKPRLVVDIISVFTLYGLNKFGTGKIILDNFGKLSITHSTIEHLRGILAERKGPEADGFMILGREGSKFIKQDITKEDIERSIQTLEDILLWISNFCEVVPCIGTLGLGRDQKRHLDQMIGVIFSDTIIAASENGNVLYSDDERLRNLARTEFGIDGVWTQPIMMHFVKEEHLEKSKYCEMVVKLVCSNYYHTSIDAYVLIEAAKQANWTPSDPYITVAKVLRGDSADERSAVIVAVNFLYELWKQPIMYEQRECLILKLIDIITEKRKRQLVLEHLVIAIRERFKLLPLAAMNIIDLIDKWKKLHVL